MRKLFPLLIFFILFTTSYAQNYGAKTIFKKYNDAVVVIYACDNSGKPFAQGSGVVLNSQGLIVTNFHVCKGADVIKIKHEDLLLENVNVLGGSEDDDIMFLKVGANNFNFIPAGKSENLEVGQKVYAIGSPLGFENSITEGIVNGFRNFSGYNGEFIQISASISHGSSGGALITAGGKLIGITSGGMEGGQNINFAIPIKTILSSNIYIANYYEEPQTEKKEKKTKKKKTQDGITSTDTEKKVKKPRKKKKDSTEITSGAPTESIAKVPGKKGKDNIRTEESSYDKLMMKGKDALSSKDFKTAVDFFSKAIALDSRNSLAYYARAVCYLSLKEYDYALNDLNYFLEDRQDFADAYFMRGAVYHLKEKYREAAKDYLSSLELDKSNMYAVFGLGECYYELDECERGVLCFNTFIAFDKTRPAAYYYRGLCLLQLGNDYGNLDACDDFSKSYSLGMEEAGELINQYCK